MKKSKNKELVPDDYGCWITLAMALFIVSVPVLLTMFCLKSCRADNSHHSTNAPMVKLI